MAPKGILGAALLACASVVSAKYDQYILAPSSRTVHPVSVWQDKVNGTIARASSIAGESPGSAIFQDAAGVTYDFGKNIAGLVTLQIGETDPDTYIGLTYSESSLWISAEGSDATQDSGIDEIYWFKPTGPGKYSVDRIHERGGFRYLSLVTDSTGNIEVQQITVYFTAVPQVAEDQLRNYTGYFHCNDELLNRVWYAGAYTNQLCTIDPTHGNSLIHLGQVNSSTPGNTVAPWDWYLNYTISNGSSALVDGAKRDRLIWPGDLAIGLPSIFASTNDLETVKLSLTSLFSLQNQSTGMLPYAGKPFPSTYSPTYHLWNLVDVGYIQMFGNDLSYLEAKWPAYKKAMKFSTDFIDSSGLFNATSSADWLRFGMGGHNIEANAILYYTLNQAIVLAETLNDTSVIPAWQEYAAGIKTAANKLLWNATAGLYHDNETTTLMPQDGNSIAVFANLTDSPEKAAAISKGLASRWTAYGAPAVEAQNAVSPFISGFELHAHVQAGNVSAALALLRLEWGFMLDDPRMTNSTFIEGYQDDGVLHYAPYSNDPRISHAHGWATAPTAVLSMQIAGLQLTSAAGQTWKVAPQLGDLTSTDAGFQTPLGSFSAQTNVTAKGDVSIDFSAPVGTMGVVGVPYPICAGVLVLSEVNGACEGVTVDVLEEADPSGSIEIDGLQGGDWELRFTCGG